MHLNEKSCQKEEIGTPVIHYLSTNKDYLLTKEAIGHDALAFLDQPEKICRTMAEALKKLNSFYPQNFPSDNHLQAYKERALKNYEKGEFYAKALLPQFQINSREEAFQLIQEHGHLLKTDAFIATEEVGLYQVSGILTII